MIRWKREGRQSYRVETPTSKLRVWGDGGKWTMWAWSCVSNFWWGRGVEQTFKAAKQQAEWVSQKAAEKELRERQRKATT